MPGFAVSALVLVLVAAVVGGSLLIGAPVLAVPLVFLILVIWGGARVAAHRGRPEYRADEGGIEFTERDRQTLTPAPGDGARR
jgi:hypothetical protein